MDLLPTLKLFDEFARSDPWPKREGEGGFDFMNRVNAPYWAEVRHLLENWFGHYPEADQKDLRDAYRSRLSGQHLGAWWELYVHELFRRLGFEIEVHPTVEGTRRRPDFRIHRDGRTAIVEAAALFSGIAKADRRGAAPGWMTEAVETVDSPDFFVNYEAVVIRGPEQLKRQEVARPIQEWIDGLDADLIRTEMEADAEAPHFVLRCRGWEVSFFAWPLNPERRGRPGHRVVGAGPAIGGAVDDISQLESKLKVKASRYGRPEEPYVIAILCLSAFMERLDIEQALFGHEAVAFGGESSSRLIRQRNGFWVREDGPQNRRVSAVLTSLCVQPWSVTKVKPELWLNPWADHGFDSDLPFTALSSEDSGQITSAERDPDMGAIFDLASDWPPGKPFPRE
jgi:hypothetical protein